MGRGKPCDDPGLDGARGVVSPGVATAFPSRRSRGSRSLDCGHFTACRYGTGFHFVLDAGRHRGLAGCVGGGPQTGAARPGALLDATGTKGFDLEVVGINVDFRLLDFGKDFNFGER